MSIPTPNNRCTAFFDFENDRCSQCDNPNGIFKCHGCVKAFCEVHAMEHRKPLKAELHVLLQRNEELETEVNSNILQIEGERLTAQIDEWEKQSIEKVRRAAEEARTKVSNMVSVSIHSQVNQLLECREVFTKRLLQAADKSDFHERHLEYWNQFLEDLKQNFSRLRTSYLRLEYCTMPFISKILVREIAVMIRYTKWCYYQQTGAPRIDIKRCETGQQWGCSQFIGIEPCESFNPGFGNFVHEFTSTTDPGFNITDATELRTGEYRFRLSTGCVFIGIISKSADVRRQSLSTRSVYGWTGDDTVYLDGVLERGYRGYKSNMQIDDTVVLVVNCEQKVIRLNNLNKNTTYELHIDVQRCPLPWLLKFRTFERD